MTLRVYMHVDTIIIGYATVQQAFWRVAFKFLGPPATTEVQKQEERRRETFQKCLAHVHASHVP